MDGDAGFRFSCSGYCFVYMHAVHPFTSEFRQQCRVKVDDPFRISVNDSFGNQSQVSGQDDERDAVFAECREQLFGMMAQFLREMEAGDLVRPGYVVNPSRCAVADYEAYTYGRVRAEAATKPGGVASLPRGEDGDLFHVAKQRSPASIPKYVCSVFSYQVVRRAFKSSSVGTFFSTRWNAASVPDALAFGPSIMKMSAMRITTAMKIRLWLC